MINFLFFIFHFAIKTLISSLSGKYNQRITGLLRPLHKKCFVPCRWLQRSLLAIANDLQVNVLSLLVRVFLLDLQWA